jgi:HTH-type transcriptional regulator / antitoxin HigA
MPIAINRNARRRAADAYMELIRKFPLRKLKNDDEHRQAVEIIEKLMGRAIDSGACDYLDMLILIVNKYEDEHHTPKGTQLTPQQALRAIMNANDMTQSEMGKVIGSESVVSMFLKGERELSKSHIKALVARFRVDAALFL